MSGMDVPLGRLEPVDPRQVWASEAQDFTPWLLANGDVLSQAVGMDLTLEAAEHAVGGFSLDLIGTDRAGGGRVIVENQLEVSDHLHMGQILTYAGGTDPTHVVWVATGFRPEHRAALEWLNERTDERTRFFAVQVQAVRIGDSPAAPLLTLVVQPNDWGKHVRASAAAERTWQADDFFTALQEAAGEPAVAAARRLFDHTRSAGPRTFAYWGVGRKPSMTAQIPVGSFTLQPWTLYVEGAAGGGPVLAINFEWIHKNGNGVSDPAVAAFAQRLRPLPGLGPHIEAARTAGWRKRPSIPAGPLLRDPGALDTLSAALDELYEVARAEADQRSAPPVL